jgi:signal transduction histidine kinase
MGLLIAVTLLGLFAAYCMVSVTLDDAEQRANFVSAVTDELKSPLTSIRMYIERLEAGMVTDEKRSENDTISRTESEQLARLVDDVLAFSRIERGWPAPEGETGTVGGVVDDLVRMFGPQAEKRGAKLVVDVDERARAVQVDRDALSQVLVNLVATR